jgi:protoheme IX farnesyltransferase
MSSFFKLIKARVVSLTTLSAVTGYILAGGNPSPHLLGFSAAVFILAGGSATLNECQEWRRDAMMKRTSDRPIPAGLVSPRAAFGVAAAMICGGLILLAGVAGAPVAGLGALAVASYNGVYTHLKKVTAFAAVQGAVIGTITPAMGWLAGGGALSDPSIHSLMAFIYIWQLPHFWLLFLLHGEDYRHAGFPTLRRHLSGAQISRLIFQWISAALVMALLFPVFGMLRGAGFTLLLILLAAVLLRRSLPLLKPGALTRAALRRLLIAVNGFALLTLLLLILDRRLSVITEGGIWKF